MLKCSFRENCHQENLADQIEKLFQHACINAWLKEESQHFWMKVQPSKWHLLTAVRDTKIFHLLQRPLLDHFLPNLPASYPLFFCSSHSLGQVFDIYMHIYIYIHTYTLYIYTYTYIYTNIYVYISTYTHVYTHIYTFIPICIWVYMYMICVCIYVCVCVRVYKFPEFPGSKIFSL